MHELSIAQSILDIVNQHLPAEKPAHVKSVKVKIGKLSNVLPDSLRFCFEAITKDSDFEKTVNLGDSRTRLTQNPSTEANPLSATTVPRISARRLRPS